MIPFVSESLSLSSSTKCLICGSKQLLTIASNIELFKCPKCGLYAKQDKLFLSPLEEFKRYDLHSSVVDEHYNKLMNHFVQEAIIPFIKNGNALDYGCGKTGVIKHGLEANGYNCEVYDPYFANDPKVLNVQYDVVTATEVVEHFQALMTEWQNMVNLVKQNGYLAIMTQFAQEEIGDWWYLRDSTHYHFYQERTFEYIAKRLGLTIVSNNKKNQVTFQKISH